MACLEDFQIAGNTREPLMQKPMRTLNPMEMGGGDLPSTAPKLRGHRSYRPDIVCKGRKRTTAHKRP